MPWLTKRLHQYRNTQPLTQRLANAPRVELGANVIVWPLSYLSWSSILLCLFGIPCVLVNYNITTRYLEITLIAIAFIVIKHLVSHFKTGLTVAVTKDAIELPAELAPPSVNYFQFSRVNTIKIQRFFYHYRYTNPGDVVKSVAKAEIITHARLILNTGERIDLSRANFTALAELIEYIDSYQSPKIRYYYPTPLKFLSLLFLLYIAFLFLSNTYGYPSYF